MVTQWSGDASGSEVSAVAHRSWWSRISTGQLVMVIAAIAAFLLNLNLIRARESVALVAVARSELTPGQVFEAADVEFIEIDAANPMLTALITNEQVDRLEGQIVTTRVARGAPVSLSFLGDPAADGTLRSISIPVAREHAAGGTLIGPGDVVDMIAVNQGRARYVVTGAQVIGVNGDEAGTGIGASQNQYSIVVAVDASTALAIAEALQAESIEVVRATGAPTPDVLMLPQPEASDGVTTDTVG